jgi:hypothetical protein
MSTVQRGFARMAAIAAAVMGLVAGCADEASDVSDSGAPDLRLVDLIVALDPAVSALERERAASGVEVVSIDASGLTDVDLGEARAQTDEALAELEEAVDKAGDSGTAYGSAFDALDRLAQVRADVDARSGSIDISDTQALRAVEAPYAEMTTAILDAAKGTAQHIDDPQLRRGAALHAASVGQLVQEQELMRFLVVETVGDGLSDTASVAEASRLNSDALSGRAEVMELAAGSDYADIAERLRADLAAADLTGVVQTALETGVVDIQALLSAASTEPNAGWQGFLARLEEALRQQTGD